MHENIHIQFQVSTQQLLITGRLLGLCDLVAKWITTPLAALVYIPLRQILIGLLK